MILASLVSFFGALVLCCLFFPSVWTSLTGGDEFLDAHEAGLALVSSRTPFRESGPPACMAKLIMLRHKIHQDNTRRRCNVSRTRQTPRLYSAPSLRPPHDVRRLRVGSRRLHGKQNH